jgi:CubicO group peptidase (beta-lactamase class C family)
VAPGFEEVAEAFAAGLESGEEAGGAFAAIAAGETIVDIWGGVRNRDVGAPWERDTLCGIFSGSKGVVATCVLMLVDRGLVSLDDRVATHWPDFAAKGKGDVLVSHILSHQAGLPGIRRRVDLDEVPDSELMVSLLASQEPFWPAGERLCYHPLTYGWLCGELVRRVTGRSIGEFLRAEVADPLGLDIWIGLPNALEPRVADCFLDERWEGVPVDDPVGRIELDDVADIWLNPDFFSAELPWNRADWRAAEIPGAGAIATARSMADHYSILASGGSRGRVRILGPDTIALGQQTLCRGVDPCDGEDVKVGAGWILQTAQHLLGPPDRAFGHGGAGGCIHGAWPDEEVGFSYVTNQMRDDEDDDRGPNLLRTLHACLS